MLNATQPDKKNVVLLGAGHAHAVALREFTLNLLPEMRLTLISRTRYAPYSGMLPGLIAGHYRFDDIHVDACALALSANARFVEDEAIGLDLSNKVVICRRSGPLPYDRLSIDIGSRPNTVNVRSVDAHAIPVKPIDQFIARFEALGARTLARNGRARVAMVGAGVAGAELLLSAERRLSHEVARAGFDPSGVRFTLISGTADILPGFPAAFRSRFRALFAERGIALVTGAAVVRVDAGRLLLADHRQIEADELLWATQAAAAAWLAETGAPLDKRGFLKVDETLRLVGRDDVFAAGDAISFAPRELPKSGVYAVRAGPVLAANIHRSLTGEPLRPFRPQRHVLYLVSTGDRRAVGTRNGLTFEGAWAWRWKDWIDRAFVRQFRDLPENGERAASGLRAGGSNGCRS